MDHPAALAMIDWESRIEIVVCQDCTMVLVNGDSSGIEDADAHLARMDATLPAGEVIFTCDCDDHGGFRTETCGACGVYTATDDWHDAVIIPAKGS